MLFLMPLTSTFDSFFYLFPATGGIKFLQHKIFYCNFSCNTVFQVDVSYWKHTDYKSSPRLRNIGVPEVIGLHRTLLSRRGWLSSGHDMALHGTKNKVISYFFHVFFHATNFPCNASPNPMCFSM